MTRPIPLTACVACLTCLTCLIGTAAIASIVVVRPDGTGDFPTIQAAVDAVVDGDVIELSDGIFTGDGNRDVDFTGKAITVRSQSDDPATCAIDCGGSEEEPHRGFRFGSGETATSCIIGVTITHGWIPAWQGGGAILCELASSPLVDRCVITDNRDAAIRCTEGSRPRITGSIFTLNHGDEGGALSCEAASAEVEDCAFVANTAAGHGGACHGFVSSPEFTGCRFEGNSAGVGGAISLLGGGTTVIRDCAFVDNVAASDAGALMFFCFIDAWIEDCTFAGNRALHAGAMSTGKMTAVHLVGCTLWANEANVGSGIVCDGDRPLTLESTIIAAGRDGEAIYCERNVFLSCCDLHGNVGGDWIGAIAEQLGTNGNIAEDPLFCDAAGGDWTIEEDSPCAPQHAGDCGLIGAWEVGCGSVAVAPRTWGSIKSRFR